MANVSFLRGTQAKLDKLTSFTEGAFYLTTDSDRLYFAQSASELVHLNHNVIHVASVASLPAIATAHVGDFYYALSENVLCTKATENSNAWTQINKNSNDDTKVTGIDDVQVVSSADGGITVSFDIKQSTTDVHGDVSQLADIPVSFTIKGSDIATANNVDVGVATSAVTNGVKVATTGDGASGAGFNLTASGNAAITRDSSGNVNITSKDTTYTLNATNNQIVLTDNINSDKDAINLASDNDAIEISAAADTITVKHKAYLTKAAQSTAGTAAPDHGESFTVIDSITTDKGHVTAINTKTVTLPDDTNVDSELSVEANGVIRLTEVNPDGTKDTFDVTIAAGTTGDVVVSTDTTNDKITVDHKTYADPSVTSATAVSPKHGTSFTVVDSISATNGHITGYKTKMVTLPADNNTVNTSASATANNEGKITVTVTDNAGDTVTGTSGQVLYYTVNGEKVYNQGNIDFYTKEEIDEKVEAVNAMTYKGTVGTGGTVTSLPSSGVKIGDTYKVVTAGTHGGHSCDVGDLLIALGTETDGVITSGLTWTYVPSGDDVDSQYEMTVASNVITLKNTVTKDNAGTATIAAGNDMVVSTSGTTITVAHETFNTSSTSTGVVGTKTSGAEETLTHGGKFIALTGVKTDNGHLTGYEATEFTLPEDQNTTSALSVQSNGVIRLTETALDGTTDTNDIALAADGTYITIATDTTNNKITANHKTYTAGNASATSGAELKPGHGGQFTVVTAVSRDSGGHLNGVTTQKVTLPTDNNTVSALSLESGNIIRLTESGTDNDTYDVKIAAGTQMSVTSNTDTDTLTIAHGTVTTTKGTDTTASPDAGTTVTVLDSITTSNGHVTGYVNKVITLPEDTTSAIAGAVSSVTNGAKFTTTLTESNTDTSKSELSITSTSLKVAAASASAMTINLEWGSF